MPAMHAKRKDEYTAAELIESLRDLHMTPADLKSLIGLTQEMIEEEVTRRVDAIKSGRDGASLPKQTIRNDLTHGECGCRYAVRLCETN